MNIVRDLKHKYPTPKKLSIIVRLYKKGHYLPYTQVRGIEEWIAYKKDLDPQFYKLLCKKKIYLTEQSARTAFVMIRRMGITVKNGRLNIY